MTKIKPTIKVHYVMEINSDGQTSCLALFPTEKATNHDNSKSCYAHIGQHSSCNLAYCLGAYDSASKAEYKALHEELEDVYGEDFKLQIITRKETLQYAGGKAQ